MMTKIVTSNHYVIKPQAYSKQHRFIQMHAPGMAMESSTVSFSHLHVNIINTFIILKDSTTLVSKCNIFVSRFGAADKFINLFKLSFFFSQRKHFCYARYLLYVSTKHYFQHFAAKCAVTINSA